MPNDFGVFGVESERKAHSAIKSGKEEQGDVAGAIGFAKVDGQRLFKGLGSAGMGTTSRAKNAGSTSLNKSNAGSTSLNKSNAGSFKVRKRTAKG
jgi:hypothetical protein